MSVIVPDHQVWIDALFTHFWARLRRYYVHLWLLVSSCGIVFLAWPAQYFTEKALWGPGEHDDRAFLVAMGSGVAITVITQVWAAGVFRPIIRLSRGEPVRPEAVWLAAVRRMPVVAIVCTASYAFIGNVAILGVIGPDRGFGALDYVGAWLVMGLITSAAGFFFVLIWEVAYRPVLREVQPLLPDTFAPGTRWLTLSRRSAIASASAMAYAGAAVSCLVAATDSREEAMVVSVLASLGVALTFGGVITALVSHSIFMRVNELTEALVRIGRREYDVRVAVRAGDELDEAAASLNRMAERLRKDDLALNASRARLASIADMERRRMERDLRRRVLARLHRLGEDVVELEEDLGAGSELLRLTAQVRGGIADAVLEIRRLAMGVYPAELTSAGLGAALSAAAGRAAVPTTLRIDGVRRLDPALESAVYFCCSEALQNAAKHAGERATVTVALAVDDTKLRFSVSDDGVGLATEGAGIGMANMRDRIRAVGGDLRVISALGQGTSVLGWVPAEPQSASAGHA